MEVRDDTIENVGVASGAVEPVAHVWCCLAWFILIQFGIPVLDHLITLLLLATLPD